MRNNTMAGLLVGAIWAGAVACMLVSLALAHTFFLDRLVLNLHFGPEAVAARNLRIVQKKPLVVSNGDVLPNRLQRLYGILSILSVLLGWACYFASLWVVDKALFSGQIKRFLSERMSPERQMKADEDTQNFDLRLGR